jgi:hypothetical protein
MVRAAGFGVWPGREQKIAGEGAAIHAVRLHLVAQPERAPVRLRMQSPANMRDAEGGRVIVGFEMFAQVFGVESAADAGDETLVLSFAEEIDVRGFLSIRTIRMIS